MNLLVEYIVSLVNLNGIIEKDKVIEIYNMHNNGLSVEMDEVGLITELKDNFVRIEGKYFVHQSLIELEDVQDLLKEKYGKPFYIPERTELLKYQDEDYFERTKAYNAFFSYVLTNLVAGDVDNAVGLCEDILIHCQDAGPIGDVLAEFGRWEIEFKDNAELSDVIEMIVDVMNNTRLWSSNGYTPKELYQIGKLQEQVD